MTRSRWIDLAVAGLVTVGIDWEISLTFTPTPRHLLTALLQTATGVALVWRRRAPVPVAVIGAAAFAAPAVLGPAAENLSFAVAYFVISYSVVAHAPRLRTAVIAMVILGAGASTFSWIIYPGVLNLLIAWLEF